VQLRGNSGRRLMVPSQTLNKHAQQLGKTAMAFISHAIPRGKPQNHRLTFVLLVARNFRPFHLMHDVFFLMR
jgi:hypothetical protein